MSNLSTVSLISGLLLLVVLVSGFLLSRAGKPYHTGLLSLHKLLSLASLVLLVLTVYPLYREGVLGTMELVTSLVAGTSMIAAIGTGGALSATEQAQPAILTLHQIASGLSVLDVAAVLYLLLTRV